MKPPPAPLPTLHATALIVGDAGVLIRGRSGAGKSRLAEELVEAAQARGWFGRLVADDRVMAPSAAMAASSFRRIPPSPASSKGEARALSRSRTRQRSSCGWWSTSSSAGRRATRPVAHTRTPADLATVIDGVAVPRLALLIGDEAGPSLVLRRLEVDGAQKRG